MARTFPFIANDVSLDFANTQVRDRQELKDLVETSEHMMEWVKAAGISTKPTNWQEDDINAAKELRGAIRKVMNAVIDTAKPPKAGIEQINKALSHYGENAQLIFENDIYQLRERNKAPDPAMILGILAERAASLLVSDERQRIKCCSHPDCILLFKDTSKSGKRRWCDMKTCGNRAKAEAYRTQKR
ncbi:MAG: CGNR zinc finger domain-containing protein [Hyphomicrobiales bacterium]